MSSFNYDRIFSCFLGKVTDYDLIQKTDANIVSELTEKLHSAIAKPYVRRLFSSIVMDDQLNTLSFAMKQSVSEEEDEDFVIELLGIGLVIEWLTPIVNSTININWYVTSNKESKYYSQSAHITQLRGMLDDAKKTQRDMIRDRGYIYNSYIGS